MLRSLRIFALTTLAISLLAAPGTAATTTDVDAQELQQTDTNTRTDVSQSMADAASARGLDIDAEGAVYATRDDLFVVNSLISEAKDLTRADLARGADVGFIHVDLPEGSEIPSGFYKVRVTVPEGSDRGTAELIDDSGNVAATVNANAGQQEVALAGRVTTDIGILYFCVDYHWGIIYVEACIGIKIF